MFDMRRKLLGEKVKVNRKKAHSTVDHKPQITTMLKVIWSCEMPDHLKRIMTTRIWGIDPKVFCPLTPEKMVCLSKDIDPAMLDAMFKEDEKIYNTWCFEHKKEIDQIKEYEKQGRFHCEQFLLSVHAQEIIDKFNTGFIKNKGLMFNKDTFGKKRFSV